VAEGAERPAEVDVLGELGCDLVQGFVFSRPVASELAPQVAADIEREARTHAAPASPVHLRLKRAT
jgi:EAL domain-containing protein (putative c-di-GMP-specific phosphodiesterase class I)